MKKKMIKYGVVSIFILTVSYMLFQIFTLSSKKKEIAENLKSLPKFEFTQLNTATTFNSNSLEGENVLIVHFNSTCHFCEEEIHSLLEEKSEIDLADITVVLISEQPLEQLKVFIDQTKLDESSFIVLKSEDGELFDLFGSDSVPKSFLYNKNGELIKQYNGFTKVETLIDNYLDS